MKTDINQVIKEIAIDIDDFINDGSITKDQRASYIVGSTMMRDDYDELILTEPAIEDLAELAAAFEASSPDKIITPNEDYSPPGCDKNIPNDIYLEKYFEDIINRFEKIKKKYNC